MKNKIYLYLISLIATFYAASAYAACNVDLTGTWNTTETVNASDCGRGIYTEYDTLTITQTTDNQGVCNLSVTDSSGMTFTGSIDGYSASWTGSFPDSGGTIYITSSNFTAASDGNSFNGRADWYWSDGNTANDCDGYTDVSGVRSTSSGDSGGDGGGGGGGGCGFVNDSNSSPPSSGMAILFLLFPVAWLLLRRMAVRRV